MKVSRDPPCSKNKQTGEKFHLHNTVTVVLYKLNIISRVTTIKGKRYLKSLYLTLVDPSAMRLVSVEADGVPFPLSVLRFTGLLIGCDEKMQVMRNLQGRLCNYKGQLCDK